MKIERFNFDTIFQYFRNRTLKFWSLTILSSISIIVFRPREDQRFEQHSIVFFPDEMSRYRMLCLAEVNGSEMLDVDLIQCYLVKVATKLVPKAITFLC